MEAYQQVNLRLPHGMREAMKEMAKRNRRSMAAEMVFHLERALRGATAATGETLQGEAPAAAHDTSALQGADIHQRP